MVVDTPPHAYHFANMHAYYFNQMVFIYSREIVRVSLIILHTHQPNWLVVRIVFFQFHTPTTIWVGTDPNTNQTNQTANDIFKAIIEIQGKRCIARSQSTSIRCNYAEHKSRQRRTMYFLIENTHTQMVCLVGWVQSEPVQPPASEKNVRATGYYAGHTRKKTLQKKTQIKGEKSWKSICLVQCTLSR